jgi:antitoxin (DNA-binding transcriptional repressor) of toxin-antitoxin stability system
MREVNMHEARSQLSTLVEGVLAGGQVVIARAGEHIARLAPYRAAKGRRIPGRWKGQLWVADDFDATPEDMVAAFEGNS